MSTPIATTAYERTLIENVERYGWHCTSVVPSAGSQGVPFSYTVGMHSSFGQPEFLILGLDADTAHSILDILARAAAAAKMYPLDKPCDQLIDGYSCVFVEVPKHRYEEFVVSGLWFNGGKTFRLYQIVWPDEAGRFPWHQEASSEFRAGQPVVGTAADA